MKPEDEMDRFDDHEFLRQYLLGTLSDESVRSRIEKRLIADDEYAEHISAAEDELIEEFLDGELTADELQLFTTFFLAPPERRQRLRLVQGLRRLAAESASVVPRRQRSLTKGSPSWGWLRFSLVAAAVLIAAFSIWRLVIYKSDTDRAIEQLHAAYRHQRPVESRLAEFSSYAPFSETRGSEAKVSDEEALERADRYLLDATSDPNDARAHRARAIYFLARHDTDGAIRESETALNSAPYDARMQSDAGAVYYEAAKSAADDPVKQSMLLDKSLAHLERAIDLDPNLLEPRFDLALSLEALSSVEQAKAAWRKYSELDPNSRWSDEARRHLQRLEQSTPTERSANELESDLLDAIHRDNRSQAAKLVSESREAIREKYMPQRLAMSLATAEPDRRDELLHALEYVGEIELERTGDGFAKDIAHFYSDVDEKKLGILRGAQQAVREGNAHCIANDYSACLSSFRAAHDQFELAGDEPEMRLAEYFIGYAQLNTEDHAGGLTTINGVADFASSRGYRWLEMTAMYWVGGCLNALKRNTDAIAAHERALALARKADDNYAANRNLNALAELESYARQDSKAIGYIFEAMRLSSSPTASQRQRYRDLAAALPIFSRAGLYQDAKYVGLESIVSADKQDDQMWKVQSRGYTAVAFKDSGDIERARELVDQSRSVAESTAEGDTRQKVVAFSNLRSGDVEYAAGDYAAAERFYSDAAAMYDGGIEIPLNREESHLGVLKSDLALGNTNALEEQIAINIRLTEESRHGILDESQRTGFFDSRVNVYDIAAEFELSRGNAEAAYDYAERSNSRSLLDHMLAGLDRNNTNEGERALLRGNAVPLTVAEIRARIPADVQIVQYSVFSDRLIIWILSKDAFAYRAVAISEKDLEGKVESHAALISRPNSDGEQEKAIARELYELLIGPVRGQLTDDRELCVVPNRALFEVSFAALLGPDGKRLVQKLPIVYAPSANVFVTATDLAAKKRSVSGDESLLAVGDPSFDRARHPSLSPVADAMAESEKIRSNYQRSKILLGRAATKSAFVNAAETADVVHFAGHYVAESASPMSSYLLMAQSGNETDSDELTNIELAGLSLGRTRLVVLSACDSGAETWYQGEGMIGAARSLLAAGVPLVVASQWSVDTTATSDLMIRFHQLRVQHRPTADALRQAQIAMIDGQVFGYSAPYYWAGFGAFGGSAKF